ncbi:PspC domain-containing protein [Rhodohalobacter sp. SW132]|nr:PspC domain-containing protein [Rhodohalobacter sp. SW132]
MVAIICIGFLKGSKKEKHREKEKEEIKRETYDKLDEFLYSDAAAGKKEKRKSKQKSGSSSSFTSGLRSSSGSLTKSRTDRKLFGVCGGLAKYLGLNSTVLRIGFLIAFFLSSGSFFLLYIAMAVVMPKESIDDMDDFK